MRMEPFARVTASTARVRTDWNGSAISSSTSPTLAVEPWRSSAALSLRLKPSSAIAATMTRSVSGRTYFAVDHPGDALDPYARAGRDVAHRRPGSTAAGGTRSSVTCCPAPTHPGIASCLTCCHAFQTLLCRHRCPRRSQLCDVTEVRGDQEVPRVASHRRPRKSRPACRRAGQPGPPGLCAASAGHPCPPPAPRKPLNPSVTSVICQCRNALITVSHRLPGPSTTPAMGRDPIEPGRRRRDQIVSGGS